MGAKGIVGLPVPAACFYQRVVALRIRHHDLMEGDVPITVAQVGEHLDTSWGDLAVEQVEIDMGMGQILCHGGEGYGDLRGQCIIR